MGYRVSREAPQTVPTSIQLGEYSGRGHNLVTMFLRGWAELERGVLLQFGKPALQGGFVLPLLMVQI